MTSPCIRKGLCRFRWSDARGDLITHLDSLSQSRGRTFFSAHDAASAVAAALRMRIGSTPRVAPEDGHRPTIARPYGGDFPRERMGGRRSLPPGPPRFGE